MSADTIGYMGAGAEDEVYCLSCVPPSVLFDDGPAGGPISIEEARHYRRTFGLLFTCCVCGKPITIDGHTPPAQGWLN